MTETEHQSEGMTRNYALGPAALNAMAAQYAVTKAIPNPYAHGAYFYFIEALMKLGPNVPHKFMAVREQMRTLMSVAGLGRADRRSAWDRFENKRETLAANESRAAAAAQPANEADRRERYLVYCEPARPAR